MHDACNVSSFNNGLLVLRRLRRASGWAWLSPRQSGAQLQHAGHVWRPVRGTGCFQPDGVSVRGQMRRGLSPTEPCKIALRKHLTCYCRAMLLHIALPPCSSGLLAQVWSSFNPTIDYLEGHRRFDPLRPFASCPPHQPLHRTVDSLPTIFF